MAGISLVDRVVQIEAIEYGLFAPLDEVEIRIDRPLVGIRSSI
jgi:hypothetical protein